MQVLYIIIWPYPGGLFRVKFWSKALQKACKPKEEAKTKAAGLCNNLFCEQQK